LTNAYARSDRAFFHDEKTKDAIKEILSKKTLVIYCGAGTTIDRTSLDWPRLIREVFPPGTGAPDPRPTGKEAEYLHKSLPSAEAVASILARYDHEATKWPKKQKGHLVSRLHKGLYEDYQGAFTEGRLVNSIVRLAATFVTYPGHKATIITTNYDTYLEMAFSVVISISGRRRAGTQPVPTRPRVSLRGASSHMNSSKVNLIYLHGRVPEQADAMSEAGTEQLVLTERDYASAWDEELAILGKAFSKKDPAVLILGASLSDHPLIHSLASTHQKKCRYAILPAKSIGLLGLKESDQPLNTVSARRHTNHIMHRGVDLGVEILVPDFYFQVGQFCEEAYLALTMIRRSDDEPAEPKTEEFFENSRYGERLLRWWNEWWREEKGKNRPTIEQRLTWAMDYIKRSINSGMSPDRRNRSASEKLGLELWVRQSPETKRCMKLRGRVGDIIQASNESFEVNIGHGTNNKAVEALIRGQPMYWPGGEGEGCGFAVPIWLDRSFDSAGSTAGDVAVGALVLRSNHIERWSGIRGDTLSEMVELKKFMIVAGRYMLSTGAERSRWKKELAEYVDLAL